MQKSPADSGPERIPADASTRAPAASASAAVRIALWLTLGSWVGAWAFFGLVVAPIAFRVLPSADMAGLLIGPVLEVLQLFGAAAGLLLSLLAWSLRRGVVQRALPLAMAAACLYSQFGLSTEIAEIQNTALGPQGSEALAARFTHLHRLSVSIFVCVGLSALVLAALHARDDAASGG